MKDSKKVSFLTTVKLPVTLYLPILCLILSPDKFGTIDMPRVGARKRLNLRKQSSTSTKPSRSRRTEQPRRQWTSLQMEAAMKAVEDGSPINQAAREHGVPKTTLRDRLSRRVIHGTKPGPKPYLTGSEDLN